MHMKSDRIIFSPSDGDQQPRFSDVSKPLRKVLQGNVLLYVDKNRQWSCVPVQGQVQNPRVYQNVDVASLTGVVSPTLLYLTLAFADGLRFKGVKGVSTTSSSSPLTWCGSESCSICSSSSSYPAVRPHCAVRRAPSKRCRDLSPTSRNFRQFSLHGNA